MKKVKKALLQVLIAGIIGGGLGCAFFYSVFGCSKIAVVNYSIRYSNDPDNLALLIRSIICMSLLNMCLMFLYLKAAKMNTEVLSQFNRAVAPLILLWLLMLMPFQFYTMLPMVFVISISAYRLLISWPGIEKLEEKLNSRNNLYIVILIFLGVSVYFAALQVKGLNVMYLTYNDWAVYYDIVLNSLEGKWFLCSDTGRSFLGEHFIPGTIIFLMPFVWITKGCFGAFFWLSAALLCCGSVFVYLWAVKLKIPTGAALLLSLAVIMYPSLSNMNYCIFYGFHDIYVIFPFIYLFAWLYESKRMKWAFVIFLLTLTIKETVPIFWLGVSGLIFLDRRRGWAIAMFLISAIYFLLVMKVIIPSLNEVYAYDGRFGMLGGTMLEIALSPFAKPDVFWGQLFRPGTFYYLGTLLIPLGLLTLCRPILLLPGLVIILVTCLQDTDQMQNIALAYQTEFVAISFIAMVLVYRDIHQGKIFPWLCWLGYGMKPEKQPGFKMGLLLGVLITVMVSYYLFGLSIVGKQSLRPILEMDNRDQEIRKVSKELPPCSRVQASERLASFLFLDHNLGLTVQGFNPEFDYIIFDIRDRFAYRFIDPLRFKLLRDPAYSLIMNQELENGCWVMMFKKEPRQQEISSSLVKMNDFQWRGIGSAMMVSNSVFEVKSEMTSLNKLKFYIRLVRESAVDADIEIMISGEYGSDIIRRIFGDGISPAPLAEIGDVYVFKYDIPPAIGRIEQVLVNIKLR